MIKTGLTWGRGFFLLGLMLIPGIVYTLYRLPPGSHESFYYQTVPYVSIVLSAILVALSHLSYPRVKNPRLMTVSITAASAALLQNLPYIVPFPAFSQSLIFIIAAAGITASILLPGSLGSRGMKIVLSLFLALILSAAVLGKIYLEPVLADISTWIPDEFPGWIPAVVSGGTVIVICLLSVIFIKEGFGLEGIIPAAGILYALGIWISVLQIPPGAGELLHLYLPAFLVVSVVIHWFLRLDHRAHYDPLLKIYNRGYAETIIEQGAVAKPYSVVLFDIDHFKKVNDTHGHQAGDMILFETAQVIQQQVVPGGILCRYGGEEIIAFFPGKTVAAAVDIAEHCRKAVSEHKVATGKKNISVTVSAGAGEILEGDAGILDAVARADSCLYKAKENGRNRVIGTKEKKPRKTQTEHRSSKQTSGKRKTAGKKSAGTKKERLTGKEWKSTRKR